MKTMPIDFRRSATQSQFFGSDKIPNWAALRSSPAIIALAIFASHADAGVFGIASLTGDGDSGISSAKTYTHAFDMARDEPLPFLINGVPFSVGGSASGTDANHGGSYTATGLTNTFQGHGPGVGGLIGDALEDFFFRATGDVETITLAGLTPGQVYKTVFYTSAGFGGVPQTITFSDTGQTETGVDRASGRIEYAFNAPATGEITYTFMPDVPAAGSFHQYAFTNERSPLLDPIEYVTIPGLFNTGVDNNGVALGANVDDPHYEIISQPAPGGVVDETVPNGFPIGPWLANNSGSRWIGPNAASANGPEGGYTYRTTFDLTGLNASTAYITGDWGTDNGGIDILLNGVSVGAGQISASFNPLTSFVLDATLLPPGTFVDGINTLDFVFNNAPTSNNPTGLRVDNLQGIAATPEPGSLLIWAVLGLTGVAGWRRRK